MTPQTADLHVDPSEETIRLWSVPVPKPAEARECAPICEKDPYPLIGPGNARDGATAVCVRSAAVQIPKRR